MNLKRTIKFLPKKNRISRMRLVACLRFLGVKTKYDVLIGVKHLREKNLWDLAEKTKALYIAGCKRIRTDLAENHELACVWNMVWRQAKKLFWRRGIEI